MLTPILIQMADRRWTMSALHLAFAMSRRNAHEVALVQFVSVPQVQWLGTPLGDRIPTPREYSDLKDYRAAAEDYDVQFVVYTMQYVTLLDAIVQAAERLDAHAVFAKLEPSLIPLWHRFQIGWLRRKLEHSNRLFYSLEQPTRPALTDWVPSVFVSGSNHTGRR